MFTVVRSVLLAPLPYPEPDRLVQLWTDERARGRQDPEWLTPPDFEDWRRENRTFAGMAAYQGWGPDLTGGGEPEALRGAAVSASIFAVLGVRPALGRDFTAADDDAGAERVAILSDGVWRRRFGADPGILGRAITLSGEPWTVIGVLGREFRPPLPFEPEVWRPMRRPATGGCGRDCIVLRAVGRMRPGVTLSLAHQDLAAIAARLEREFPDSNRGRKVWLIALHEQLTGASREALVALSVAVGFVLLIGCVNLANLLLVRGAGRARELAVRAALGAGRGRLLRQLLTESLVLAVVGGAVGLALAVAARSGLATLVPAGIRQVQQIRFDAAVLGFSVGLTMLAGLLFGLVPAFRSLGTQLMLALRGAAGERRGRGDGRLRGALVAVQLSLSVILLVGAGLLLRSFLRMQQVDLGYRTEGLVTANVLFPRARYQEPPRAVAAIEDLLGRLRASPAVRVAEVTDQPPLGGAGDQDIGAVPVGEPPPADQAGIGSIWYRTVSTGYLPLMRMRLVRGRHFTASDRAGGGAVAVINQEAARRYWGGKDPVGRVLASGTEPDAMRVTIIGVVETAHPDGPQQPVKPEIFLPMGQFPVRGVTVVIEPNGGRDAALEALRSALRAVDPLVPISGAATLEQAASRAVSLPRAYALFVAIFGGVALALAGLGVYGVMAYAVAQRQREIGVRLALGAAPSAIRGMILGQGARLALLGAAAGLLGAAALTRLLRTLLFGVNAFDPVTFAAVPVILGAMALLAAWIPARRATRVDPLLAIRAE
jgi:predicted permease